MTTKQPLPVDYSQAKSTAPLVPNPPVFSSHGLAWNGINLAYHRQPAWELPELAGSQHLLVLPIAKHLTKVEFAAEGQSQCIQYYPDDHKNGFIELFPAELPYKCAWNREVEFIHYYLEPSFVSQIAHESINPDKVELLLEVKKRDFFIYHVCLALKANLEIEKSQSRFYVDELATALSAHLIRSYSTRQHQFPQHRGGLSKREVGQTIAYINEHLNENLSLMSIATELGMSPYSFCRLFKRATGMTPHQYLIQQRIDRAKRLLKHSTLTITQIAIDCGFANSSHFAKYFYRQTGLTPKQFRQT